MSQAVLSDPSKPTTFSAVLKQINPPTAVDNCLYCYITHTDRRNLVITRGSFIDIYSTKEKDDSMFLNLLLTTCVYEDIVDIIPVRFVGDELDSLLISFAEAKVAIVGFDSSQYELKTHSLHNYEFENLKSGRNRFSRPPILRVDPLQRCAVMLVYDRHLAVLPFRRSETVVTLDRNSDKTQASRTGHLWEQRATAPLLATFTTCLSSSTGEKINNVLDMQFLHGFYEPTLLILYEPIGTWAGRVSARRDTCCIVALSFNLQKRTNPVIWFQEFLPYDCTFVHAVPQPIGGALILAANSIIYVKQTLPSCGLPLNCYTQLSTNFPMRQEMPQCAPLVLDRCRILSLDTSQFLITTSVGKLCLLSLWVEQTTQTVSNLLLHMVGRTVSPHCMTLMEPGYLFVGSRLCDSVLLRYTLSTMCVTTTGKKVNADDDVPMVQETQPHIPMITQESDETAALPILSSDAMNPPMVEEVPSTAVKEENGKSIVHGPYTFDEVDLELYGESILDPPSTTRELTDYSFQTVERIMNFGPLSLLTSGEVPCLAPGNTDPSDEALTAAQTDMLHVEMVGCVPRSFEAVENPADDLCAGGILLMHTSVRPRGLTAFELPEYMSLWSLYGPPVLANIKKLDQIKQADSPPEVKIKQEEVVCDDSTAEIPDTVNSIQEDDPSPIASPTQEADGDTEAPQNSEAADKITVPATSEDVSSTPTPPSTDVVNNSTIDEEGRKVDGEDEPAASSSSVRTCRGPKHSYLLLTREDSTMILEVGHEIVELEVSGFNTAEMTVIVVNLGSEYISTPTCAENGCAPQSTEPDILETSFTPALTDTIDDAGLVVGKDYPYILQVSPTSLRLLDGPKLIEYIQVTAEWRIHLASSADPYTLLCTEDDELILCRLRPPHLVDPGARYRKKPNFLDLRSVVDNEPMEDGQPGEARPFTSTAHLDIFKPKTDQVSAPLCFCLYHDHAGLLSRWLWARRTPSSHLPQTPSRCTPTNKTIPNSHRAATFFPEADFNAFTSLQQPPAAQLSNVDEEDIILYGEPVELWKTEIREPRLPKLPRMSSIEETTGYPTWSSETDPSTQNSAYFAFILFTNGVLEIYSLPEFTLLYQVHQFSDLPAILIDHRGQNPAQSTSTNLNVNGADDESIPPTVLELSVFPMGRNRDRPVLVVRTSQEIAFFEALCPAPNEAHPYASGVWVVDGLRWRRLPIPCPLMAPRRVRTDPRVADMQSNLLGRTSMLRHFEDIDGNRGIFVCGGCPVWLFSTDRGQIQVFNHSIDGIMGSFAPLNTTICPSGFVYFTHQNEMRLATLPPGYSYRESLGVRWIPLGVTPYFVQYHVESKTYAIVGTKPLPCSSLVHLNADGNKEEVQILRPPTCALPALDRYSLELFAPSGPSTDYLGDWQAIPNTRIEFEEWEAVTCMITAQLASEETFHGTKDYLALGANLSYGEEIPVRGRIVILDLIDVVPEPGQPLTRHKLKTIYDGEQKGPVSAMTSCQGHLISAIGQKVYIWTMKNGDLVGVAFVDSELYIHNLFCVKNIILASDVLKSIQLLRFQSDFRVLSVVSRDSIQREVYTANFFVDGRRLGFLVSDEYGNVVIYSYDPLDPSSRFGRRLVRRADLRLPTRAITSLRVANRLRHALLSVKPFVDSSAQLVSTPGETADSTAASLKPPVGSNTLNTGTLTTQEPERLKHSIYLGTSNGSIYLIAPIRDKMFSRLRITEKNLIHHFGPTCGMLPKMCWSYRSPIPELANPCGQVADAELLWRYLVLSHNQRLEIAKKSGQSLDGIMDDIADLNATTLHF